MFFNAFGMGGSQSHQRDTKLYDIIGVAPDASESDIKRVTIYLMSSWYYNHDKLISGLLQLGEKIPSW